MSGQPAKANNNQCWHWLLIAFAGWTQTAAVSELAETGLVDVWQQVLEVVMASASTVFGTHTYIYISRCEYTYIFGVYQTTLGCSDHGGSNLSTEGYAICCLRIRNDMFEHNLVLCMYHTGWLCPTTAFSTSCDNTCNSSVYASIVGVFSLVMIQSSTMVTAGLMHV
jgi:hypothetical protein